MTETRTTAGRTTPAVEVSDGDGSPTSVPRADAAASDRRYWAKAPMDVAELPTLSDGAYRLWTWLDAKAGTTGLAKASYAEMAKAMPGPSGRACSPKTIARRMRELLELELLTVVREPAGHGRGWYLVANPARRRGDRSDAPTASPEGTDLSERLDRSDPPEALEVPDLSPLLGSTRDLEQGSPREGREAVAVALLERSFGGVEVVDDDGPRCGGCGAPTEGEGETWCSGCAPF